MRWGADAHGFMPMGPRRNTAFDWKAHQLCHGAGTLRPPPGDGDLWEEAGMAPEAWSSHWPGASPLLGSLRGVGEGGLRCSALAPLREFR